MLLAGLLSQIHAFISIALQADQVVSGLALTFVGTGVSLVLGEGLSKAGAISLLPTCTVPMLVPDPGARTDLLHQPERAGLPGLSDDAAGLVLHQSHPAGSAPAGGWGIPGGGRCPGHQRVPRCDTSTCLSAACWQVLAGATISLAVSPGWFSELTTGGQGWIAIGLVIFAQWDPLRAAVGSYAFGALRRLILDIQGPTMLLGLRNPFYYNPYWGFFLQMIPYAFTIIVLVIGSREATRKRIGAPAALGEPYIRGERGK